MTKTEENTEFDNRKLKLSEIKGVPSAAPKRKKSENNTKTLKIEDRSDEFTIDIIQQIHLADAMKKNAEERRKQLLAVVSPLALNFIQRDNLGEFDIHTTLMVSDDTNAKIQFQCQNSYPDVPESKLEYLKDKLRGPEGEPVDTNALFEKSIKVSFDKDVFKNANGRFNNARYKRFQEAMAEFCDEEGIESPIKADQVTVVKQEYHADKFRKLNLQSLKLVDSMIQPKTVVKVMLD